MQKFASFYVKGSAPEPYRVIFTKTGDKNLSADCDCTAGIYNVACKHKLRILANNPADIVNLNMDDFNLVQTWLPGSDVHNAMQELKQAEKELKAAKDRVTAAKRKLFHTLED